MSSTSAANMHIQPTIPAQTFPGQHTKIKKTRQFQLTTHTYDDNLLKRLNSSHNPHDRFQLLAPGVPCQQLPHLCSDTVQAATLPTHLSRASAAFSTSSLVPSRATRCLARTSLRPPCAARGRPKADRCRERDAASCRARSAMPTRRMQWCSRPGPSRPCRRSSSSRESWQGCPRHDRSNNPSNTTALHASRLPVGQWPYGLV